MSFLGTLNIQITADARRFYLEELIGIGDIGLLCDILEDVLMHKLAFQIYLNINIIENEEF